MGKSNKALQRARKAKNDEFMTRLVDIENELQHYKEYLKDKIIYCPFDTPESNFIKYFYDNFNELGIKELYATGYVKGGQGTYYHFDGKDLNVGRLAGDGDFRSPECKELLDKCDIVISNGPFSLFRDTIFWLDGGTFKKNNKGEWERL